MQRVCKGLSTIEQLTSMERETESSLGVKDMSRHVASRPKLFRGARSGAFNKSISVTTKVRRCVAALLTRPTPYHCQRIYTGSDMIIIWLASPKADEVVSDLHRIDLC